MQIGLINQSEALSRTLVSVVFLFLTFALIIIPENSYGETSSRFRFKGFPYTGDVTKRVAPAKPRHTKVGEEFYKDLTIVKFAEGR